MACEELNQKLKNELAEAFFDFFEEGSNKYMFLAISKTTPWTSEPTPDVEVDSVKQETDFWRECIAAKRILNENISLVVPRYDWSTGLVWDSYRDDEDMFDDETPKKFYVLVDEERVYKCIDNNNGVVSTQKPIETSTNIFQTSDGYRWKYLYKITSSQKKFLSKNFMPVKFVNGIVNSADPFSSQLDVQNAAIDGAIQYFEVTEVGDRFLNAIPDNPSNQIQAKISNTVYRITSDNISLVDGAYLNYSVKITDPASDNFAEIRRITAYDGDTRQITIESAFTNPDDLISRQFSIIPTVLVTGDGTNALGEAKINTNTLYLESVEVSNAGSGYTFTETTIIPAPNSGTQFAGSTGGITAACRAILGPVGGHGFNAVKELGARHVAISIDLLQEEGGLISGNHDFRQFGILLNPLAYNSTLVAGTENDRVHTYFVSSPNIINQFSGLTTGDKRIIGNSSGFNGLFYDYTTTVGNAKTGSLEIKNPNGTLTSQDKIIISDPAFTNASLKNINVVELTSNRLLNNKTVYRQTVKLEVTDATNSFTDNTFVEDTRVTGTVSGATGTVASWTRGFTDGAFVTNRGNLELVNVSGTFSASDDLKSVDSNGVLSSVKGSVSTISNPELTYRSGDLIYVKNIQVLERDDEQQEEFYIVVGI